MIIRYRTVQDQRKHRIRKKLRSRGFRPRLSVFRSNTHIYAQIIDDSVGKTLVSASDHELEHSSVTTKVQKAQEVGSLLAQKSKKIKVKVVMFDRGAYQYHGRVEALAQAARKGGLVF